MSASRNRIRNAVLVTLAAMGVGVTMMPAQSKAAVDYYNPNGTASNWGVSASPGTSWEGSVWSTTNSATASTIAWPGVDAGFAITTPAAFTVNVGQTETDAGFFETAANETITVQQAASTTGGLSLSSGLQGFSIASGSTIIITCPISGTGGPEQQNSGQLSLYGSNSYTGGTETTGGQVLNYNNNHSYGTGSIIFTGTSGQGLVNGSSSALTIPNNISWQTVGGATNFVSGPAVGGAPGTTYTGTVTLPASGSVNFESGTATSVTKFSDTISGASGLQVSNPGKIIFGAANTYTGPTTLTAGTLQLAVANSIAHSTSVVMNGGTLDASLATEALVATLGLSANSTINAPDDGVTELDFADSHGVAWTGSLALNFTNWMTGFSLVRFGTTSGGLTSAQLAEIEFNGDASTKGTAQLTSTGYLVPEPTSVALLLLGAPMLAGRRRGAK